jgi:MFS family permease
LSAAPRSLTRRLIAFSLLDEVGPLFAIYPLLFADGGLTAADLSLVFIVWAVAGFALELPSGVVADLVDRRRLIAGALAVRAIGFITWLVLPGLLGAVLGALLVAVHGAAQSGAFEAIVYDELVANGAEEHYGAVSARTQQAGHVGTALGTLTSAGLLALDVSLPTLGIITIFLHLPAALLVLSLPRVAARSDDDDNDTDGEPLALGTWWRTLREGWRIAWTRPGVGPLVLLGSVLGGLFILDEYIHYVARARGADDAIIPLFVASLWAGLLVGGELAARRPHLSPWTLALLLASASALALGGLLSGVALGLLLIAVCYGALQATCVIVDARMQPLVPSSHRATVSSLRAMLDAGVSVLTFTVVGALAVGEDPGPGLVPVLAVLILSGAAVARWVPTAGAPVETDAS